MLKVISLFSIYTSIMESYRSTESSKGIYFANIINTIYFRNSICSYWYIPILVKIGGLIGCIQLVSYWIFRYNINYICLFPCHPSLVIPTIPFLVSIYSMSAVILVS